MAEETISTRIVANADFSALISDVHRVTASLSKLQQELATSNKMLSNQIAVMNRSFSDTLRSTGQYSTHFVSLQSDVEKFGKNLDGGKLKLNQYFNAFRDQAKTSGGLIRDLAKQQVALQNAVLQPLGRNAQGLMQFNVHVPRGLDVIKNKTAIARQELAIFNKVIQDGATGLINWGKNTQWAGRQLTVGLTVPLIAFGNAASKAFREADQELVRLTKVYGDISGTSVRELGQVRKDVVKTAKDISAAMGVSFKETIGLAADIAATGKTGQELLGSIQETTRLAVLGEVDRQEAMKATLAIQTAFQQNTEELAASINFLNAVENQTSTTLNDLVEAIPKAGPVIKQLGGSVEELALYLTAMREGGINASEGANALKSGLASLINPTKQSVGVLGDFGIDILGIVSKNAGNTTGMLMELQGALNNLNPLNKAQAIEQLFGKFQFARISALLSNLGAQGSQTLQVMDLMKASTAELATVADRELQAVTESASGKYRRAIESLRASLAEVGEQFLTINTTLIQVIDKVIQFANNLPGPVKQVLALAGGFTAVIGPVIMLTGVLANFFGYLMKGVFSVKSFFKGNDGWKYLTPEILAAEKAGKLVEQTFYSDAKAAAVLKQALGNLIDEFSVLEAKAKSGAMSVNPAVSTMAGNLVMAGGGRVVNPAHPLAGTQGTRASTHMVPRSGMTDQQRMQQTMFGMVPGSIPLNQKIGQNPQIYMNDQLPNVPGLTTVGGVSTGVVAGEAAKHHAMMATLGMQSKAEIELLKKTIVATGTVNKEFMMTFDDILPLVSKLTDNAARESALIVAELRAGKLTIEAARAKIIALNLQTEQMISSSMQAAATGMGRTLNPTMIPTLNQPVVDPTGKSNMRELFKKGKTRDFINKIAGTLGVRTSGAGYNIETTKPRKFATGGRVVYRQHGSPHPEMSPMGTDTVPAMLTPGEYVINAKASKNFGGLLEAINNGASPDAVVEDIVSKYPKPVDRSQFEGAHASGFDFEGNKLPSQTGSQVGSSGVSLDPRTRALTQAFPNDAIFQTKDKNILRISKIINQLMKEGQKGSTKGALLQAIKQAMRTGVLFEDLPVTNNQVRRSLYKAMLSTIKQIPSGNRIDDAVFANVYRSAIERVSGTLSPADGILLRKSIGIASLPQDIRIDSRAFRAMAPENLPVMTIDEARAATEVGGKTWYNTGKTKSGKTGKTAVHIRPSENFSMSARSGDTFLQKPRDTKTMMTGAANKINAALRFVQRGRKVYTPDQRSIDLTNKWRKGYSDGGMVYMAKGGMVPKVQYFQEGSDGAVKPSMMGGGMAASFGGMGLMAAGSMVGGGAGQVMSSAGMAMSFMPMLQMIPKVNVQLSTMQKKLIEPIGPLNRLNAGLLGKAKNLTGLSKAFGPVLRGLSLLTRAFSPIGIALTATIFGVKKLIEVYKDQQEAQRVNRLEFGMSSQTIKKAGYSMTDYGANIKKAIEDAKALQERNRMLYESMFQANIPIKMTIAEYKKLREETKKKMPDLIELFNQKGNSDVATVAARLKAQFMSLGDNVETATAKVYALMAQSNKAQLAAGAIGTKGFASIKTAVDAAVASAGNFDDAMAKGDAKAAADSLMVTFEGIGNAIKDNAKTNKLEFGDSMDQILKKMATTGKGQVAINQSVLSELKKQNPELAKILNSTDTATSAWAKYQLALQGVNLDLQTLSGEAANAALKLQSLVVANTTTTLKNTAGIKEQYTKYEGLQKRIKDLQKASEGQSAKQQIDSRKVIEGLNEQIKKIKDAADAKIKALRAQSQAENDNLELQKLQLEYQEAIARGDQDAAARSQIAIQQLTNQVQSKKAEDSIIAKAELEIKPLQDQIDKLGKKNQELADKAALAGESLSNLQKQASTLKGKLDGLEKSVSAAAFNKLLYKALGLEYTGSSQEKTDLAGVESFNTELGGPKSVDKVIPKGAKARHRIPETFSDVKGGAKDLVDSISSGLQNGVNAKEVNIYTDKLAGAGGTSLGGRTKEAPLMIATNSAYSLKSNGELSDIPEKQIISQNKLEKGQFFKYNGITYEVLKTGWGFGDRAKPVGRSLGGPVTPGRKYLVNDRINALGEQKEVFMPTMPGMIKPNIDTAFNIPSQQNVKMPGILNSPNSNNTYNIDIELNGTNITVDDVMKSMEAKMKLVGATLGRPVNVGGKY